MSAETCDTGEFEQRVTEFVSAQGLSLPPVLRPLPTFVPWRLSRRMLFLSGQACLKANGPLSTGPVRRLDAYDGRLDAALTLCALNLLAATVEASLKEAVIPVRWLQLRFFVRTEIALPDERFEKVAQFLQEAVSTEPPLIAPTIVGVTQLPLDSTATIDGILKYSPVKGADRDHSVSTP